MTTAHEAIPGNARGTTRRVTLSFDNGPDAITTPAVLSCLARHDIRASFFVLGAHADTPQGSALVREASAAGHWIGNHTYTHSIPLGEMSGAAATRELERTHRVLEALGIRERLFRPFGRGGSIGPHLLNRPAAQWLEDNRYSCILWNSVPGDWHDTDGWVERAIAQCMALDWSLVVLHDLPNGAMAHLDRFITALQATGCEFGQAFPPDCMPLVDGRIVLPMDGITTD